MTKSQTPDQEAIEAAARQSADFHWQEVKKPDAWRDYAHLNTMDAFKDGVQWRDQNPSPAVKGLVEALKSVDDLVTKTQHIEAKPEETSTWAIVRKALAAWEEESLK